MYSFLRFELQAICLFPVTRMIYKISLLCVCLFSKVYRHEALCIFHNLCYIIRRIVHTLALLFRPNSLLIYIRLVVSVQRRSKSLSIYTLQEPGNNKVNSLYLFRLWYLSYPATGCDSLVFICLTLYSKIQKYEANLYFGMISVRLTETWVTLNHRYCRSHSN